jgi:hypothetical protein
MQERDTTAVLKLTKQKLTMKHIIARIETKDWRSATETLHDNGFVVIKDTLKQHECDELISLYNTPGRFRKTISMERYRFGAGEYKYFQYPLPDIITAIRETVYPLMQPVANKWMQELNIATSFPSSHEGLKKECHKHGQDKPTVSHPEIQ